jgi:hypothetical protein
MPPSSEVGARVYAVYDLGLASLRQFPELPLTDRAPDYHVRWQGRVAQAPEASWTVLWRLPSGEPWAMVARGERRLGFRFPRYATLCAAGDTFDVAQRGYAADDTIRHLLLDQVLPLILAAQGHLVLHASAVLLDGRVLLLAGDTGAGKSTLAARLSVAGASVLADDGVLLREGAEGLEIVPSYPGIRLFDDAAQAVGLRGEEAGTLAEYTAKRRYLPPGAAAGDPGRYRPGTLYVLETADEDDDLHISPLSRRDTVVALCRHAFRADLAGAAGMREQFDTLTASTGGLDAWRVGVPRRFERLRDVAAGLADHARGRPPVP